MDSFRQNIRGLIVALVVFLLLVFILKWNYFVGAAISLLSFGATYLLSTPRLKIGNTDIENMNNAIELKEIYDSSKLKMIEIRKNASSINDKNIRNLSLNLAKIGDDIIKYLEDKPKDISTSRHFLDYYLSTAKSIVENYNNLDKGGVSEEKFIEIKENTEKSIRLLTEIFKNQRDSYHKEVINDLKIETDLLEKTVKLGGDK